MNRSDSIWTKIAELIQNIQVTIQHSTEAILSVDTDLNVLAINARIQAARIGTAGAGIKVVADRMEAMIEQTKSITDDLNLRIGKTMKDLTQLRIHMESRTRGLRLSQIAASCTDLIDRSLYERSCDVRFWATDDAIIKALEAPNEEKLVTNASQRLGMILQSYTVYFDIVLCGLDGTVLCNGRSNSYHSRGANVSRSEWYTQAYRTSNGTEFGFEGPLHSALVNDQSVLVYSCGVRKGGNLNGKIVGVLAVLFNWKNLGTAVLHQAEETLSVETDNPVKAFLCRNDGKIVATETEGGSTPHKEEVYDSIVPVNLQTLRASPEGFHFYNENGHDPMLIGFGVSRGYETYSSNWITVITEIIRR
ncbi:MAG: hypothetical protein LBB43_04060 [Spirochaetaceae bacterium]|jgi:hypothetical protein|nr:hypothetical protein [Spirochaetaceae bacterium]